MLSILLIKSSVYFKISGKIIIYIARNYLENFVDEGRFKINSCYFLILQSDSFKTSIYKIVKLKGLSKKN